MILSLLVAICGSISIENPGIRLELFLKDVSKQTGQSFHCPTYLNNEVLAASFKDQSIDVLKAQLARVIHGVWEQKEDGWWLVQTSEQKKEEERWSWDLRNYILQSQIDGLKAVAPEAEWTIKDAEKYWIDRKSLRRKGGEAPKSASQQIAAELQTPDARFCSVIGAKLSPSMFSEDPLKFSVSRYSVRGLRGHIDLPIDLADSMSRYSNERTLYQMVSETTGNQSSPQHVEVQLMMGELNLIRFSWLDKNWRYLGTSSPSIFFGSKALRPKAENFPVSKDLRLMVGYVKELTSGPDSALVFAKHRKDPLFADAISVIEHATTRDPLGLMQGRNWIEFATSVQKPLLVSLKDDDIFSRLIIDIPQPTQTGMHLGMMREDADGWVLGRPIHPAYNRAWRIDRKVIEDYARLLKVPMTMNLYPLVQLNALIANYTLFTSGIPNGDFLLDDRRVGTDLTAVLGTLSEEQLNNCLNGARIPVGSLPQSGQELMSILVQLGGLTSLTQMNAPTGQLCPLYYLPEGTRGMSIGASLRVEPEFRFESVPDRDSPKILDVEGLARLVRRSKKESPIFDAPFKLGSKRTIVAVAYLGQKLVEDSTSIPIIDESSPSYTWKTLPGETRQLVFDAIKRQSAKEGER